MLPDESTAQARSQSQPGRQTFGAQIYRLGLWRSRGGRLPMRRQTPL